MSTSLGTGPRGRSRPPARLPARPRLRAVTADAPGTRSNGTFVVVLVAVLAVGMVGLLMLNTAMQRSAFALDDLQDRAASLSVRRQVLDHQVERQRSPERLARRAIDLGMVPMASPVFLRLEDGRVLGQPSAAVAGTGPQLVPVEPAPDPADQLRDHPGRVGVPAGTPDSLARRGEQPRAGDNGDHRDAGGERR